MLNYCNGELEEHFCQTCTWYKAGACQNPDAEYLEPMEPEDGCTLWEEE